MRLLAIVLLGGVVAACTPGNGPLMRPGDDCLRCHGGSGGGDGAGGDGEEDATPWSLAGTVYASEGAPAGAGVEGVDVRVVDANRFSFTLHTNQAGNFYSAETVAFPLQVCVARSGGTRCMSTPAPSGACNLCHAVPPLEGAAGRIAAP